MPPQVNTVGVVGLGTMGAGIAEVLARSGLRVLAIESNPERLAAGLELIRRSTQRALDRGKLAADDRAALLDRVAGHATLDALAEADLVIEAVPERLDLKREIFARLDQVCRPDAILATNTSSLPVTEIAVATASPSRVLGMHFFNPAPVQRFMEIIRTVVTAPEVVEQAEELARRLGKSPVVAGDRAGFIANALLFGYLNHAVTMLEQGYASREDIDLAMTLGCGLPMGPLALLDLIGLDTAYEILDTMYRQGRDRLHAPAPLLRQLVTAGFTGRKRGRGFYGYPASVGAGPGGAGAGGTSAGEVATQALAEVESSAVPAPTFTEVTVVGTGTMASQIAELAARSGFEVHLVGRTPESLARAAANLERSLSRALERGRLEPDAAAQIRGRIKPTTSWTGLAGSGLAIEAVVENLEAKRATFAALDAACPDAILATTTSSLPVIECAMATSRPGDVLGLHFFNPATVMRLVEVVHTVTTEPPALAAGLWFAERVGRTVVRCADRAGFIVNALLFPYLNDAIRMLGENYATADDIDLAMKAGCGYPMGPFELLDVIGLDTTLAIQRALYLEFREPGFAPTPLLEQLVTAGYLGRKAGRGFRRY